VLLVVAARMIDWRGIRRLWNASRETRLLFAETFAAALLLPLSWAILIGTGSALVIHIANTSAPRLRLLRPDGDHLVPAGPDDHPELVVVEVSGNLHYAAVPPFLEEAERLIPPSAQSVVIDLSHAHEIRFAALRALERLAEEMHHDGGELWLAGVHPDIGALLKRSRSALRWVPEELVPGLSVRRCIEMMHLPALDIVLPAVPGSQPGTTTG
jgi:SulP family sulfate permease